MKPIQAPFVLKLLLLFARPLILNKQTTMADSGRQPHGGFRGTLGGDRERAGDYRPHLPTSHSESILESGQIIEKFARLGQHVYGGL